MNLCYRGNVRGDGGTNIHTDSVPGQMSSVQRISVYLEAGRYCRVMTDAEPSVGRLWKYRFSQPDGVEVETAELSGDDTAAAWARELSKSKNASIVIHRHSGHVDAWEYVTEVDERP